MLAPTTCRSKSWTSKASRADRNRAPRTHSTRTLRNSPVLTRWASASWSKTDLGLDGIDGPQHPDPTVLGELMAIDEDSEEPATDLEAPGQQPLAALDGPMGWCRAIVTPPTPPQSPPTRRRSSPGKSRLRQTFSLRDAARGMDAPSCSSPPGPALHGGLSLADRCGGDDGEDGDDYMSCALSDCDSSDDAFWPGDSSSDCDDDGSCFSRGFDMTPEGSSDCLHDMMQFAFGAIAESEDEDDDDGVVVPVRRGPRHTLRNTPPRATWTAAEGMRITNVSARWQISREDAAELVANVDSAQS